LQSPKGGKMQEKINFIKYKNIKDLNKFLKAKGIPIYPFNKENKWQCWDQIGDYKWTCADYPCIVEEKRNEFTVEYWGRS
jgi:hypothetical protein